MRRWAVLFCALAVLGCKGGTLQKDDGMLTVTPASLDFGDVYATYPKSLTASVLYSGKASCDVTLSATVPFSVTSSAHLLGSTPSTVDLSLTASEAGALTGALTVTGCGHTATAALSATAMAVPDCGSPGQCTTVAFDLDAGRCTTVQIADGTPCADACLEQPACHAGECTGSGRGCDDADPCTLDACSADGGCVHVPADDFCPPLPGCTAECDGGRCGSLIEVWSADTSAGVQDPLVADEVGNIYWLEIDFHSTFQGWLVSRSRSGALRFRVAVDLINASPQPMYSSGVYVLSRVGSRNVSAFRSSDGSPLWERDLHDDIEQAGHPELEQHNIEVRRGTVDATNELVFPATFFFDGASSSMWMVALEPTTGQTVWRAPIDHEAQQLAADADGRVEVWWPPPTPKNIEAYDSASRLLWSVMQPPGPAFSGRVYSNEEILDGDAGSIVGLYQTATTLAPEVVTSGYGARRDTVYGNLVFFDPGDGHTTAQHPLYDAANWDLYAANGELLAANRGVLNELDGFDLAGNLLYSCAMPLPTGDQISLSTALVDDLLLVWSQDSGATRSTLHAYVLAARSEATSGWTARYGSMARTGRAK